MDRTLLEKKALAELRAIASTLELRGYQRMKKADLVDLIMEAGGNGAGPAGGNGDGGTGEASAPSLPGVGDRDERGERDGRDDRGDQAERGERGDRARDDEQPVRDRDDRNRDRDDRDRGDRSRDRAERGSDQHDGGRDQDDRTRDQDDRDGDDDGRQRGKRERRRKNRGQASGQGGQEADDAEVREGVLDLLPEGYGFLRVTGYLSGNRDVYVSQSFVRRFDLRRGDRVAGPIRRNKNNDKFPALARVDAVEGEPVEDSRGRRVDFTDLTPQFPTERLDLELDGGDTPTSLRLVDLLAPIGKGQRGLLVSPPRAGKTTLLKQLAHAIEANHPDVHLMVLLVDERPEEVTDFQRATGGEVVSSTFDRPAEDHTQVAELCLERAKRLVERGRDVVVLLDSLTRLARAYNLAAPASGRVLPGGIDSAALSPPKRFFGAARNVEEGGSLTIIASSLVETGSAMDEAIFEEFSGTGNMELRLDRRLEQTRIFPAVDVAASGTRREELLLEADALETVRELRRRLSSMDPEEGLQLLTEKLEAAPSNEQFLQLIATELS